MTTTSAPAVPVKVRRHRVLGFLAGLLIGLGTALLLVVYGVVVLTWVPLVVGAVVGGLVGVLLVSVVPAGRRRR